ncbi:MAG: acetylxylan esterase [Lentisphaerae bacterium]|nr:acetylxylan esterase [Lentisphaerota bacterium]
MKKYFILFFTFLSAALWALEVFPAGKKYFYRTGEDIVFQINLDKGRENARFSIRIAGYEELNRTFTASADDKGAYQLRFQAEKPGFVFVEVKDNSKTAVAGAAVEPEKITAGRPCPPAFDTYWDNAKKELELMPLVYDIQEMPNAPEGYRAFEVKVDMGGEGRDLFAVLTMPADAQPGRLAAEALFHGANTDKVSPVCRPETMVLSVNPMSVKHDGPMRTTTGKGKKFHGYYHWGVDDLEKNYFPNMFKRTFRALQFLKSLPEWDHRTLIVRGTSQGGGQALAAAGLDPQVTLCIAIVPALCDHGGNHAGRVSGWPRYFATQAYRENPDKAAAVADMIDAAFFARRIHNSRVFVTAGFVDRTCVPDSVYAAFNAIASKNKEIYNDFLQAHSISKDAQKKYAQIITDHISKNHEIFK